MERNMERGVCPPFCKFNILRFPSPRACVEAPYRSAWTRPFPPPPVCQSKITRNNSGNASLWGKYCKRPSVISFESEKPFPFCRGYWSAATKCPQNTYLWRTSYMTWGTILVIKSFNADVTMTFSSFGCNGVLRYKTHYIIMTSAFSRYTRVGSAFEFAFRMKDVLGVRDSSNFYRNNFILLIA